MIISTTMIIEASREASIRLWKTKCNDCRKYIVTLLLAQCKYVTMVYKQLPYIGILGKLASSQSNSLYTILKLQMGDP